MSRPPFGPRGRMCSRPWTARAITLAHVLTLLFVGSCFCRVTEAPSKVTRAPRQNVTVQSRLRVAGTETLGSKESGTVKGQLSTVTEKYPTVSRTTVGLSTLHPKETGSTQTATRSEVRTSASPTYAPRAPARLQERLAAIDCDLPLLPNESRLWRGNETHELNLPITMPEDCPSGGGSSTTGAIDEECPPIILSWEGSADIQSGDILIVRIADSALLETSTTDAPRTATGRNNATGGDGERFHRSPPQPAVYQVTRQGHEHCDVTDGMLLDIAPLAEQRDKLITLYDKDLTEGVNLLIVVSENWGSQCVRLKVTVKSDNCGDSQDCSGHGVCYSNISMEGYECQCCPGWVGPHCEERDACAPSPCHNNGICVDLTQPNNNTYQCLCPYGFTGSHCEVEIDPCSSSPCLNGGPCSQNGSSFRCSCTEGWEGARCERPTAAGACSSRPCVNGICVEIPDEEVQKDGDAYKCFCQPGFAGERCEYEFNECESSPCGNGGTCTDRVGGFVCACGRGYTGRTCHLKVDLCSPNPCPPHRFCIDRGNSYACECPRGFVGDDCSEPAKAACDNNPCAHGGTCWNAVDSFYCACRPGYTGKLCEEDFILESVVADGDVAGAARPDGGGGGGGGGAVREVRLPLGLYHDRLHNVYIAAGTLGAAIAIVGVVVTACHCRVNKTYARFLSRVSRAADAGPPHHWLQDKRATNHSVHTSAHPAPYPPAALDTTDMYYTLDFSDSQSSPLIQ